MGRLWNDMPLVKAGIGKAFSPVACIWRVGLACVLETQQSGCLSESRSEVTGWPRNCCQSLGAFLRGVGRVGSLQLVAGW